MGAGASYEQATGSALTATTLLLVPLLKNAEWRAEHAIQSKLDALATGMLETIRHEGADADPMLQRAIRMEERSELYAESGTLAFPPSHRRLMKRASGSDELQRHLRMGIAPVYE